MDAKMREPAFTFTVKEVLSYSRYRTSVVCVYRAGQFGAWCILIGCQYSLSET